MLSAEDIQLIVTSGEGYNAEFKVAVPSKVRELTEEVCAFANAAGGVLLLGVDDHNQIKGIHIDNAKRSAIQHSISDISPALYCTLSIVEVEGKNIGVIEVPSGTEKPYIFSGAIYIRLGPNSQKLTTAEEMRGFFQQSGKIYFDESPCRDFDAANEIDKTNATIFKEMAHLSATVPNFQVYNNLKLFTSEGYVKSGAVLFFGKAPEVYFEKAIIRCVAFADTNKRYIIDDKPFGGPLYAQYLKAMQWLKEKLNVRYDIEGQGSGPRSEIWEIPETVFKESIINSLSHRDYYDKGAVTTVELFSDRIEISNPGGLVSAISPADFGKRSHSRNPLIFGLFAKMHLVEQIGSGISRMNESMKAANLPAPQYSMEGMFTVTFQRPLKTVEKTVEKTSEEKIITLIKSNAKTTGKEMMRETGLTRRGVEYLLNKLKENGTIQRVGPNKGGHWQVTKPE